MGDSRPPQHAVLPYIRSGRPPEDRAALVASLRLKLTQHLSDLDLQAHSDGNGTKDQVRASHGAHRAEYTAREAEALKGRTEHLVDRLALGCEVEPRLIAPEIVPVIAGSQEALLFRLVTTLWSVPVSAGYGRRMRFLIVDRSNDKLIGILALGDPVFNLKVRDEWIDWTVEQRKKGLVHVMDAYVVGAVPPYSQLLGGKLVSALVGSAEVAKLFRMRYSKSTGIISGERKNPRLALVTVTSALGRSSLYNRIKLPGLIELQRIGHTNGWGHFHVPNHVFAEMRALLSLDEHKYADGHRFGSGPNWRMRVIRKSLSLTGLDETILRHGIKREVYAMPLASNWRRFLRGESRIYGSQRPSVDEISDACLDRWILPRSKRRPEYRDWSLVDRTKLFVPIFGTSD